MKQKQHAREKREAESQRRKESFSPKPAAPLPALAAVTAAVEPVYKPAERLPDQSPEEQTKEFLDYLERYGTKGAKEDLLQQNRKKAFPSASIPRLNLEEGMPVVSEALDRLRMGIQEMKVSRVKIIKLIHGYGSTGRGGKIRGGVREELAVMKRKRMIRDYIPGENFGPMDAASRNLAEQYKTVTKDPDYGRINHGITIVVL